MADAKRMVDINEIRQRLDNARIRLADNKKLRAEAMAYLTACPERQWVVSAIDNRKVGLEDIIQDCNKLIAYHDEQKPDAVGVLFINGENRGKVAAEPVDMEKLAEKILFIEGFRP